MPDLETEQARLTELHAAFAAKLQNDMAAHKEKCAVLSSEANVKDRVATDKLRMAIELDAALKEKASALAKQEQAHEERLGALRARAAAIEREMDKESAARANPARAGS